MSRPGSIGTSRFAGCISVLLLWCAAIAVGAVDADATVQ